MIMIIHQLFSQIHKMCIGAYCVVKMIFFLGLFQPKIPLRPVNCMRAVGVCHSLLILFRSLLPTTHNLSSWDSQNMRCAHTAMAVLVLLPLYVIKKGHALLHAHPRLIQEWDDFLDQPIQVSVLLHHFHDCPT